MGKKLKIGLLFMLSAIILMPLAVMFKDTNENLVFGVLLLSMLLELIGLLFVILSILERRKNNA